MRRAIALTLLAVVITACGSSEQGGSTTVPTEAPTTTEPEHPVTTTLGGSPSTTLPSSAPSETVLAAIDHLAAHLQIEERQIRLITSEEVTWSDGSLGCPQPGEFYTQALVEGYKIVLNHGDRAFDYHVGNDGQPFLCPTDAKDGGYEIIPPPGFDS